MVQGENKQCYNYGEVGHLIQACPKPPKERDSGGCGQSGGRDRGRGGRRGGIGDYRANLIVAEQEKVAVVATGVVFTEEDRALLEAFSREKKSVTEDASTSSLPMGNTATYAHSTKGTGDTCSCLYIHQYITRMDSRFWCISTCELSSYTHLSMPEGIQTADGITQPVIGDVSGERDGLET